jgi:nitrite reductase/ring-hydroxylating ferredoxin subunit
VAHDADTAGRTTKRGDVPAEGEGGLFTQSWFPICTSAELGIGEVKGFDFLDGRVVVFRADGGRAQVLSAYCPHVGADLSVGDVKDGHIRCAFHHWEYDATGKCVKTGIGDPPPPRACLFRFPTCERWGLIWAFNGETAHFDVPDFDHPDEALRCRAVYWTDMDLDPWVIMCNTLDLQHLKVVHKMVFNHPDPDAEIEWAPHQVMFNLDATIADTGHRLHYRVGIVGSNIFYRSGTVDGRYLGGLAAMTILRPGKLRIWNVYTTTLGDGSPAALAEADAFIDSIVALSRKVIGEDEPILRTIRFRRGQLTRRDKALGRFLDHLRDFPRAHPSAEFIR